jgi:hypothetical protein
MGDSKFCVAPLECCDMACAEFSAKILKAGMISGMQIGDKRRF